MALLVAIPAELAGTAKNFVHGWNSDPDSLGIAVAEVPAKEPPSYSVDIINTVLVAFTGATVKTTIDLIVQRLRERYSRHKPDEKIIFRTTRLSDGTEVTEVVIDK